MEIWYNVIVFSKETLVHYYHKYVKAGVSPVSNSKCASCNRALEISKNLEKFPFLKCASCNRALNFLGTFQEISVSFQETVRVGTFLVFSRKFPKKCASRYVLPFIF